MALSDRERKLLEELEESLNADGPVGATQLSSKQQGPRRLLGGMLIAVAGFVLLVVSVVSMIPLLGLAAFLAMGLGFVVASSRRKS
jgi:Flp pilus assembly protein TadB